MTICSFFFCVISSADADLTEKKIWTKALLLHEKSKFSELTNSEPWRFWKPESVALLIIHLWVKQKACDCRVKICRCVHIGWKHLKGASPSTRPLQTLRRNMFFRHFFKGKAHTQAVIFPVPLHCTQLTYRGICQWDDTVEQNSCWCW